MAMLSMIRLRMTTHLYAITKRIKIKISFTYLLISEVLAFPFKVKPKEKNPTGAINNRLLNL